MLLTRVEMNMIPSGLNRTENASREEGETFYVSRHAQGLLSLKIRRQHWKSLHLTEKKHWIKILLRAENVRLYQFFQFPFYQYFLSLF